ncbi:MAG: hypothetical protein KUG82_01320 [Pseudomonadales bacterium]|nr:hypothetical protein [Pseudomonadales bacterium]
MQDCTAQGGIVIEDKSRLSRINSRTVKDDASFAIASLKKDQVALIQNVDPTEADRLIAEIAKGFALLESLELQAGMASLAGHRDNVGDYFMTVDKRKDYKIVTPHSEGSHLLGMQMAAFYCLENTTDGGETILMNVDQNSEMWGILRDKVVKGVTKRSLSRSEKSQLRMRYRLNMPEDSLTSDDEILKATTIDSNITLYDVLASPKKLHSNILNQDLHTLWYTTESIDYDSLEQFKNLLLESGLLKQSAGISEFKMFDSDPGLRIGHFGSRYDQLFKCKISYKLQPNDLVIQNNLTWTHGVANWTPSSGHRRIIAAFA